jgi:hypothetical protein
MSFRDPDLGRDRTTAALGRRDWGWFAGNGTMVPADREPGQAPWGSTRHVTSHDRFDRTLGIPERTVPLWPLDTLPLTGGGIAERARAVCDEILADPGPQRAWPDPRRAVALLQEVAGVVYGRDEDTQKAKIIAAGRRLDIEPIVAVELAGGVGALIAQTTHRQPEPVAGAPRLNMLAGAQVPEAVRLFLARDRIRVADTRSDPDLPRLWMLANGLTHGTPAAIMRRVPARSVGPAAKILPWHEDLIDWWGMATAVTHMRATVTAAAEGRRWLDQITALKGRDDTALALGVVALTKPSAAAELARHGRAHVHLERIRAAAGDAPLDVVDLSDQALKGTCDRNGWLLGSPSERTQRELVQRSVGADAGEQLRDDLVAGAPDALGRIITAGGADDETLDRRAFRKNPPDAAVAATQGLLNAAATEALSRFAGFEAEPRASYAEAFAHRFPARLSRGPLTEAPERLLDDSIAIPATPNAAQAISFDFGL